MTRQEAYNTLGRYRAALEKLERATIEFDRAENAMQKILHETFPLEGDKKNA
jgi:hypothetical protein